MIFLLNNQKNQIKSIKNMNNTPKRLLDHVREQIHLRHYPIRTEQAYVTWIRRYILFHSKKHPKELR
jgi:hypothetical protein